MIKCPNCNSDSLPLIDEDDDHLYVVLGKLNKQEAIHNFIPLNGIPFKIYGCVKCNFLGFYQEETQDE